MLSAGFVDDIGKYLIEKYSSKQLKEVALEVYSEYYT